MDVTLTYHHDSNEISFSFWLNDSEDAFAVGFGKTCDEAENDVRGWFDKESELSNKTYLYDADKPFISIMKKNKDGKIVRTNSCINVLKDRPIGTTNQITVRKICF